MRYLIYSQEVASTGTPHYQGYVQFLKKVRQTGIKKMGPDWARAHLVVARGSVEDNKNYCSKDATHVAGPFEFGVPLRQGTRSDLNAVAEMVLQGSSISAVAASDPCAVIKYSRGLQTLSFIASKKASAKFRNVLVFVFWGVTGTGKTRSSYDVFGAESIYKLNSSTNSTLWFDGYEGERVLILDDFKGWIRFHELLTLLDGYPYRAPIKGGHTWAAWDVVIITSNTPSSAWYHVNLDEEAALRRRITDEFSFPEEQDEALIRLRSCLL